MPPCLSPAISLEKHLIQSIPRRKRGKKKKSWLLFFIPIGWWAATAALQKNRWSAWMVSDEILGLGEKFLWEFVLQLYYLLEYKVLISTT